MTLLDQDSIEDYYCDAICSPDIHSDEDGNVWCTGCGTPVLLRPTDTDANRQKPAEKDA